MEPPASRAACARPAAVALLGALRAPGSPAPPIPRPARAGRARMARRGAPRRGAGRWTPDRARMLLDVDASSPSAERRPASGRVLLTLYGDGPPLGEDSGWPRSCGCTAPSASGTPAGSTTPPSSAARASRWSAARAPTGSAALPRTPRPGPRREALGGRRRSPRELPEASAALLAGLLLGERTALPREIDDAFRRAGVYHVLAVSGFNVALVWRPPSSAPHPRAAPAPRRGRGRRGRALIGFALVVGGSRPCCAPP